MNEERFSPPVGNLFDQAIKDAQEEARQKGLKAGDLVSHPSDPQMLAYEIYSISGYMATVRIPAQNSATGQEIIKTFRLNELFNPNAVMKKVPREYFKKMLGEKQKPN